MPSPSGAAFAATPDEADANAVPLDTVFTFETPEGVALRFEPAGPVPRGLAWGIDFAIRLLLYLVCFVPFAMWGGAGLAICLLCAFAIEWLYPAVFEALRGDTPGKRLLGLEVVRENGAPLDWTAAFVRNILRAADFLPFGNALGLACILVHPRLQRLGDIAAGTLVVYREKPLNRERIPEAPPRAPAQPLTLDEQRLVLEFCARRDELPPGRAAELAALVPALTKDEDPEARLLALGNWFLRGGRKDGRGSQ